MAVFLLIFFEHPDWRERRTWWIGLILMLGYHAPFWIGDPPLPHPMRQRRLSMSLWIS
jgi:hypothetical protein